MKSVPRISTIRYGKIARTTAWLLAIACVSAIGIWRHGTRQPRIPTIQVGEFVASPHRTATGPLKVHPVNRRYFADDSGRAIVLAGSHTWSNFQDNGFEDPPKPFDYVSYIDFLVSNNHNFMRLWCWEQSRWAPWVGGDGYHYYPGPPYLRVGPRNALDGKPRFDLTRFNPAFFERLRTRVALARERGIYVSIMLFNGWSIDGRHAGIPGGNPWKGHPFHRANNINNIDGDPNGDDSGEETHQLVVKRVTEFQEAYVREVIDTLNDMDNILFEISNESYANSKEWQYHMIHLIHAYEAGKPKQHPVGMTQYQWPGKNGDLLKGPADWVSPWEELPDYPYKSDPIDSEGDKVVLVDTDHLWGIGGDRVWAWKTFLRGNHPVFMDGYDGMAVGCGAPKNWYTHSSWRERLRYLLHPDLRPKGWDPDDVTWVSLRANLGQILDYARRLHLERMEPRPDLASTGYCLVRTSADAAEYLVYRPSPSGSIDIDLSAYPGPLQVEWFNPRYGVRHTGTAIHGGAKRSITPPFQGDAVVYIHS